MSLGRVREEASWKDGKGCEGVKDSLLDGDNWGRAGDEGRKEDCWGLAAWRRLGLTDSEGGALFRGRKDEDEDEADEGARKGARAGPAVGREEVAKSGRIGDSGLTDEGEEEEEGDAEENEEGDEEEELGDCLAGRARELRMRRAWRCAEAVSPP